MLGLRCRSGRRPWTTRSEIRPMSMGGRRSWLGAARFRPSKAAIASEFVTRDECRLTQLRSIEAAHHASQILTLEKASVPESRGPSGRDLEFWLQAERGFREAEDLAKRNG